MPIFNINSSAQVIEEFLAKYQSIFKIVLDVAPYIGDECNLSKTNQMGNIRTEKSKHQKTY